MINLLFIYYVVKLEHSQLRHSFFTFVQNTLKFDADIDRVPIWCVPFSRSGKKRLHIAVSFLDKESVKFWSQTQNVESEKPLNKYKKNLHYWSWSSWKELFRRGARLPLRVEIGKENATTRALSLLDSRSSPASIN